MLTPLDPFVSVLTAMCRMALAAQLLYQAKALDGRGQKIIYCFVAAFIILALSGLTSLIPENHTTFMIREGLGWTGMIIMLVLVITNQAKVIIQMLEKRD